VPEISYTQALENARRERDDLKRQLADLSQRITQLNATIAALAALCGEGDPTMHGLTAAVRQVLKKAHPTGLVPTTVKRMLIEGGFPVADHRNPGASIHTILKRLERNGEARRGTHVDGRVFYVWVDKDAKPRR
jgi:Tfp pilus assembly protein FimV